MQLLIQWIPELRRWHVAGPRGGLGYIKWDGDKYAFTRKGRFATADEIAVIFKFIAAKERRRKGGK
jgi:hypothetical protein